MPGRATQSIEEIKMITQAAAVRRDPVAAREACESHVRAAYQAAKGSLHVLSQLGGG
ncbi:hypothetical protein D3C75_1375100 [compost metagenome]